jgi:hypothetical protein
VLREVWTQQYVAEAGSLRWREVKEIPTPADMISSPYDPEARYSSKRSVDWVGYKVHFTETCESDMPHLITNVETTPAAVPDDAMLAVVHASLARGDRLPAEHLVDKGYTDSRVLVDSRQTYGVTVIGPVADDPSWQARSGAGLTKAEFLVDWDRRVVTCPAGKETISWLPHTYPKTGMTWEARFARKDCTPCSLRSRCTKAKLEPRIIGLQSREHYEALQAARRWQTTEAFRQRYAARAGIEGTHEQAVRRSGLRRSRYITTTWLTATATSGVARCRATDGTCHTASRKSRRLLGVFELQPAHRSREEIFAQTVSRRFASGFECTATEPEPAGVAEARIGKPNRQS